MKENKTEIQLMVAEVCSACHGRSLCRR